MDRRIVGVVSLFVALLLTGCGNAAQKSAYKHAFAAEQQHQGQSLTVEDAASLIGEYEKVVRLQPSSALAKQAQERIASLQARAAADETHKSVFQEHGVD